MLQHLLNVLRVSKVNHPVEERERKLNLKDPAYTSTKYDSLRFLSTHSLSLSLRLAREMCEYAVRCIHVHAFTEMRMALALKMDGNRELQQSSW